MNVLILRNIYKKLLVGLMVLRGANACIAVVNRQNLLKMNGPKNGTLMAHGSLWQEALAGVEI